MVRAAYRIRQGLNNLTAEMRPRDRQLASQYLSTGEQAFFDRMDPADQRHSVDVLRTLLDSAETDPHLLKAALLHDVGKSRCRIGTVHRTLAVLARALTGGRRLPVTWPPGPGWWTPFYVISNHARIGASMLAKSGCEERVWRLAELHQISPENVGQIPDGEWVRWALTRLRWADEQN